MEDCLIQLVLAGRNIAEKKVNLRKRTVESRRFSERVLSRVVVALEKLQLTPQNISDGTLRLGLHDLVDFFLRLFGMVLQKVQCHLSRDIEVLRELLLRFEKYLSRVGRA